MKLTKIAKYVVRTISIFCLVLIILVSVLTNIIAWPNMTRSNTLFQCLNRFVLDLVAITLIITHGARKRMLRSTLLYDLRGSWMWLGTLQLLLGSFLLGYDSSLVTLVQLDSQMTMALTVAGWFNLIWGGISIPIGSSLECRQMEEEFLERRELESKGIVSKGSSPTTKYNGKSPSQLNRPLEKDPRKSIAPWERKSMAPTPTSASTSPKLPPRAAPRYPSPSIYKPDHHTIQF